MNLGGGEIQVLDLEDMNWVAGGCGVQQTGTPAPFVNGNDPTITVVVPSIRYAGS